MSGTLKRLAAVAPGSAAKSRKKTNSALEPEDNVESTMRRIEERMRATVCDWPGPLNARVKTSLFEILRTFSDHMMKVFSYGGPVNSRTIEAMRKYCPSGVVEVGGGVGHWARALADAGLPVASFDIDPGKWHRLNLSVEIEDEFLDSYEGPAPMFFPVEAGGASKVAEYPDRALLLVAPC